jgi:hypothetical protein
MGSSSCSLKLLAKSSWSISFVSLAERVMVKESFPDWGLYDPSSDFSVSNRLLAGWNAKAPFTIVAEPVTKCSSTPHSCHRVGMLMYEAPCASSTAWRFATACLLPSPTLIHICMHYTGKGTGWEEGGCKGISSAFTSSGSTTWPAIPVISVGGSVWAHESRSTSSHSKLEYTVCATVWWLADGYDFPSTNTTLPWESNKQYWSNIH